MDNLFKKNGYLIFKNLIPKKKIKNIFYTLDNLLKKSKYKSNYSKFKNRQLEEKISQLMIFIKNKDKKYASEIYEFLKKTYAVNNLIDEKIFNTLSKKISFKTKNVILQQNILRIDIPKDEKNFLNYHQDYMNDYNAKLNKFLGFTIWCPIYKKTNTYYGGLELLSGSHKFGWKTTRKKKDKKKIKSQKFQINRKLINSNKLKSIIPELAAGDLLLFDTRLIHKSVKNQSELARFTAQYRYGFIDKAKILN